jgi:hypothetical protein
MDYFITLLNGFTFALNDVIFIAVFVLGVNITIALWCYRYDICSQWYFWSSLCALDIRFLKKLFIQGPGLLFIMSWFLIAWFTERYFTPIVLQFF